MSRMEISAPDKAQVVVEELYKNLERRIESSPPGLCPVDMTRAFLENVPYPDLREVCSLPCGTLAAEESSDRSN